MVCIWVHSINTLAYPAMTATWVKEQVWELSVTLDGEQMCLQETFHNWTRVVTNIHAYIHTNGGEKEKGGHGEPWQ